MDMIANEGLSIVFYLRFSRYIFGRSNIYRFSLRTMTVWCIFPFASWLRLQQSITLGLGKCNGHDKKKIYLLNDFTISHLQKGQVRYHRPSKAKFLSIKLSLFSYPSILKYVSSGRFF